MLPITRDRNICSIWNLINTLCVPLSELERIAQTQPRYFVGTGIGTSGWIMSRSFLLDFMARYESGVDDDDRPDVVASKLLMEDKSNEKGWAVTRQYLVAHTHLCNQSEVKVLLSGNHPSQASVCQDVWSCTAECG